MTEESWLFLAADYSQVELRILAHISQDEALLEALWNRAAQEIIEKQDPRDFLINSAPLSITILEETYTPNEPQPSSELNLYLQVEYQVMSIPYEPLHALANLSLDALLPPEFQAQPESIQVIPISIPELNEKNIASWEILIQRQIYEKIDHRQIRQIAANKSISQANQDITVSYSLAGPSQIKVAPTWWPRLPLIPLKIQVIER